MKKKMVAALLICFLIFASARVSAAGKTAYAVLTDEDPVYVESTAYGDLCGFFKNADTDEILDPAKCNYTYGEVTLNGSAVLCHVYMRTFDITDAALFSQDDIPALTQKTLKDIKDAVCDKYIKCIAKTYYLRLTYTADEFTGEIVSMTVKVFIACGERTEDRAALRENCIAPIAEELSALDTRERFLRINGLILDGRFSYDVGLNNRSSVVDFVQGGVGVCEEYAGFTALLLDALGYENKIVTGQVAGVPHMWNMVKVEDRIYHLDVLQNGPVDAEGKHTEITRDYLLVSEEKISGTHTVSEQYKDYSALAVYDYVFDGYPESINGKIEVNGVYYLPNVPGPITVSELCDLMQTGDFMDIYKDGEMLYGDEAVCTGCIAEIVVNGKLIDTCVICVGGDIDGDGDITEADLHIVISAVMEDGAADLSDSAFLSADMNGDGTITVTDAVITYDAVFSGAPAEEPEPEPAGEVTVP